MNLFYANPSGIQGNSIVIEGQEATHISKVLRYSVGEQVLMTDGRGNEYECEIINSKKENLYLEILSTRSHSKYKTKVILCLGIIKKRDRLEFAVEKAVELGVSKIVLFEGEHSQKGNVREDRLENTAISAMKQSLRYYLPDIVTEKSLSDAIQHHMQGAKLIVADETTTETTIDPEYSDDTDSYFLIVGPEGGFSSDERKVLEGYEAEPYSLSRHRFRTETAAIVILDRFLNLK